MADEGGWLWGIVLGVTGTLGAQYLISSRGPEAPEKPVRPILPIPAYISEQADWVILSKTVNGPRNARQGWIRINNKKPEMMAGTHFVELWRVDCDTTEVRNLSAASYAKDGSRQWAQDYSQSGQTGKYYAPGTVGSMVVSSLCATDFDVPQPPTPLEKLPTENPKSVIAKIPPA